MCFTEKRDCSGCSATSFSASSLNFSDEANPDSSATAARASPGSLSRTRATTFLHRVAEINAVGRKCGHLAERSAASLSNLVSQLFCAIGYAKFDPRLLWERPEGLQCVLKQRGSNAITSTSGRLRGFRLLDEVVDLRHHLCGPTPLNHRIYETTRRRRHEKHAHASDPPAIARRYSLDARQSRGRGHVPSHAAAAGLRLGPESTNSTPS